jgi:hypothetical protein
MRTHDRDWAGLVLATSRRGVTVKPLEVYRDDEIDDEIDDATKTEPELRLRIAHAYPMKRLDGSAIMERLTFAPDGVGAVARRNAAADAPPMLTRKFRVDLTSAERAMVGAESPERMRGVAIEDDGDGNRVSESVYSLFEVHRGESSIDESPPEDVAEIDDVAEIEGESPAAIEPAPHADESAGDSISPERLGIIRRGSQSERGEASASESQAEGVAAAFVATRTNDETRGDEWKGSISFLREQLAAQGGVKLILNRVDVERLLEELTSSAPV